MGWGRNLSTVDHTSPATHRLPSVVAATNATNQNAISGHRPDSHHGSDEGKGIILQKKKRRMENTPTKDDLPVQPVVIADCGEIAENAEDGCYDVFADPSDLTADFPSDVRD